MSARRLRREMDRLFDKGRNDGLRHDIHDPGVFGSVTGFADDRHLRMAYDAGHEQGRRLREDDGGRFPLEPVGARPTTKRPNPGIPERRPRIR